MYSHFFHRGSESHAHTQTHTHTQSVCSWVEDYQNQTAIRPVSSQSIKAMCILFTVSACIDSSGLHLYSALTIQFFQSSFTGIIGAYSNRDSLGFTAAKVIVQLKIISY